MPSVPACPSTGQTEDELQPIPSHAAGRPDIRIVVGGVIPPDDFAALREAGAAAIFPPGTVIAEAAQELLADFDG